jgi:hypothetical protein
MDRTFKEWFVAERARALAMVLLTRRDDLLVKETREENGLDYTVYVRTAEDVGNRPFGVHLAATMTPVTLDGAGKEVETALAKARSLGPFQFPVCAFYFTVKDDQGYYAWAYEPVITEAGQPRLQAPADPHCRKLGNETLEEIVSAVRRWYDSFCATITLAGNGEEAKVAEASPFAALAAEFEARVRTANISGTTEVTLVYRCVDAEGREVPPVRVSIVPLTKMTGSGPAGPRFAAAVHRDTILGNINSLVRHAPAGLVMLHDGPQIPLRIVGFELTIEDAETPAEGRKRQKA